MPCGGDLVAARPLSRRVPPRVIPAWARVLQRAVQQAKVPLEQRAVAQAEPPPAVAVAARTCAAMARSMPASPATESTLPTKPRVAEPVEERLRCPPGLGARRCSVAPRIANSTKRAVLWGQRPTRVQPASSPSRQILSFRDPFRYAVFPACFRPRRTPRHYPPEGAQPKVPFRAKNSIVCSRLCRNLTATCRLLCGPLAKRPWTPGFTHSARNQAPVQAKHPCVPIMVEQVKSSLWR